jgi:hypothetical protein
MDRENRPGGRQVKPRNLRGSMILLLAISGGITAADTTWTGAVNTTWETAGNWTAGVPDSSSLTTIPDVANDPVLSTSVVVKHLVLTGPAPSISGPGRIRLAGENFPSPDEDYAGLSGAYAILSYTGGGTCALATNIFVDGTIGYRMVVDVTQSGGTIQGNGRLGRDYLYKAGAGALQLNRPNDLSSDGSSVGSSFYFGFTQAIAGTLKCGVAKALENFNVSNSNVNQLTFQGPCTVDLNGFDLTSFSVITTKDTGVATNSSATACEWKIVGTGGNIRVPITGNLALRVTTSNVFDIVTLGAANTLVGPLRIEQGQVQVIGADSLPSGVPIDVEVSANGSLAVSRPALVNKLTVAAASAGIGNLTIDGTLSLTGNALHVCDRPVSGAAGLDVRAGDLTLSATCDYAGTTRIAEGAILRLTTASGKLPQTTTCLLYTSPSPRDH